MVVLGIDPGLVRLGWGSVTVQDDEISLGLCGLISHPREDTLFNEYLNEGIQQITEKFPVILSYVSPDVIYSETVPAGRLGSRSELVVAAVTACKVIAFQWGIEWRDIAANSVKVEVAEHGKATKAQVRNAILSAFPEIQANHKKAKQEQKEQGDKRPVGLPQDVFDGIAVAVAGAKRYGSDS